MFDENKIWKERASRRAKDVGRYVKYIFNGHLVIVLLFLIGTGAFYYQQWIESLSQSFPAEIIMAIVLSLFLTNSPVYNLLLEADKVFLIPVEEKLKRFFLRSAGISFLLQGYVLLMVLAIFMPLYAHVNSHGFSLFLPLLVVLLVVKGWNMAVNWRILYFVQKSVHRWDYFVRYFTNLTITYLLLKQANVLVLIAMVLVLVLYYQYFDRRTRKMGLKWDLLIDQEEKRMASFYRLANMFTDVPNMKETVKRRKYLDFLLSFIPYSQEHTYRYLFSRTFLRSSDYLGLFVRLTVIGALAIYFISFGFGQLLFGLLFLYLTAFQLLPLFHHHQNKLWVDLYPIAAKSKRAAFQRLLMILVSIQAFIFCLFILIKGEPVQALLELLTGLLFNWLFVYVYSKKHLKV
ncbi:ABC transporter permease [Bacillus rubiinfantis]|uniref:ABC transporter permease n=1 Tax=Bacillus rubiinfantis TaxID=1499680 RepID=UPI0005A6CB45|nr:ABC transporter permease [Bacillus rubiinfantis]